MTIDAKDLNRALRATLWPALKAHGFAERTERVAWRYAGDDIDVVELQAVGLNAEATGCPPLSLSVFVAAFPRFVDRDDGIPLRNGRLRPHYWHCDPFRVALVKTLAQPWFRPFSEPRDSRKLPSFRLHRDALKRLIDPRAHDRKDIWYMRDDGSNLDQNLRDLTAVVLTDGLALLDQFHDPVRALDLINDGTLTNPTSPQAYYLRRTIEDFVAERPPGEGAGLDPGHLANPLERLYGLRHDDLGHAARLLSERIGPGEPHESLFLGGDYFLWRLGDVEVQLQHNREVDEELAEPDYPEYPLLVRVLGDAPPARWDAIAATVGLVELGG